ncbi:hypothetical protein ACQP26_19715 [Micromonospora sp. CA-248089]|uniref:hypothetical protein n=1 Tax=Micromonospora sp. CA-248089 TaxID=3239960 RepID=UPI003D92F6CD
MCGNQWAVAAQVGTSAKGEQTLVDGMAGQLGPRLLDLTDRRSFCTARWVHCRHSEAQLASRVRNGAGNLLARLVGIMPDGLAPVWLRDFGPLLCRRRAAATDRGLLIVCSAVFTLAVAAAVDLDIDPGAISFTAVMVLIPSDIIPDTSCAKSGHRVGQTAGFVAALLAAIASQALNRIDRERTEPHTICQRHGTHPQGHLRDHSDAARTAPGKQNGLILGQWVWDPWRTCGGWSDVMD